MVSELYKGSEWDDPKVKVFPQPLSLKAGQYIDYTCHYTNRESRSVSQGYASTDEMCMFNGAYWPRDEHFEVCNDATDVDDGQSAGTAFSGIVYGDGSKSGAEFLQCYWGLPERIFSGAFDDQKRYDTYSCFTQTCPKASPPLMPYFACLANNSDTCTSDCMDAQASFQASCSLNECKAQYGSDGSDGTCAKTVGPAAVAACTKPDQISAFTSSCAKGLCATACADPTAPGCAACIGTFDGSPTNPSCMNILVGACAQDQGKKLATACVTDCFTTCVTKEQTSCVVGCLNGVACKSEYQAAGAATCN